MAEWMVFMNKRMLFYLFVGVVLSCVALALLLSDGKVSSMPYNPLSDNPIGITLVVEKADCSSLTYRLIQSGGAPKGDLHTGNHYRIERYKNGTWKELCVKKNAPAFTAEGIPVPLDSELETTIHFKSRYGTLRKGTYRFCKNVFDMGDRTEYLCYTVFSVEDR